MELKFLILYPDLMNLNSDISNIKILKYKRGNSFTELPLYKNILLLAKY